MPANDSGHYLFLTVPAVLLLCFVTPAQAQNSAGEKLQEEIVVTGTRIKREASYQGGSQIVAMDRVQIDALGALAIADVLRNTPLNSYGSFSERSGSSAQSNADINLRGLGAQRTLVMIDGRRMVGSPNLGAAVTNINMIPMAAVERIDILADGASAIYGSDAVSGVVNMQMQKDFEGLQVNLRYGERSEDDGGEFGASLLGGFSSDRGNITFALETNRRDPIWDLDRSYTSPWTRDTNDNGVIEAYLDTDGYSHYGKSIWLYDVTTGFDRIRAATSCEPGNGFLGEVDADVDWGNPTDANLHTYCMYGYADVSANKAELDRVNTYLNAHYTLNDWAELYITSIISKVDSFGRFAPPAATWDDMPPDYADVPFDIDALLAEGAITDDFTLTGFYRWTNVGPRDNQVTDNQTDFTLGLRGDFTPRISYDAYVQTSQYTSKEFGYYYLSIPGLDYVLSQGIDPFSEAGAAAMSATTTQDNFTKMFKSFAQLQVGLGDWLDAGEVYGLIGVEHIDLEYQNRYDRNSEGGFVGGSAGNSSSGEREIFAAFMEYLVPLPAAVELSAAVRYDRYDDFGEQLSPTLALSWSASHDLVARARWGKGFRAPALDELYGPEIFSAEPATDQYTCFLNDIAPEDCSSSQFDTYYTTNAALQAEESETLSVGVNYQITPNLAVDIAAWDIQIDNVIVEPSAQDLFYAELAGVNLTPASGNYLDRSGGRVELYSRYVNQGELSTRGLDYQLNALIAAPVGHFYFDLLVAQTTSYKQTAYFGGPTQETNGYNLQPKYRGQARLGWTNDTHTLDLIVDQVGSSAQQNYVVVEDTDAYLARSDETLDAWRTLNVAYTYANDTWGKIKIGARNLTSEDPVLDRTGKYDPLHYDLYDNTGRVVYVDYTITLD